MDQDTRLCAGCGEPLTPMKRAGNPKKYCADRCRLRALRRDPQYRTRRNKAQNARQRAKALEREATLPPKSKCLNCGTELAQRRAAWNYCNAPECRSAKYRAGLADRPRCSEPSCDRPVIAKGLCGSHYKSVWLEANPGRADVWHSARRARKAAAFVEDVPLHALLERDGWTCGICEKPIPRDAVWPDRQSPSLDHVIPLSKGGEHSWANSQASHLSCNARKGASTPDAITAAI